MSGIEIAIYAGVYLAVMAIGFSVINSKSKRREQANLDVNFANENFERPAIGTGLGQSRPQSTYVKLSSQRRAG